MKNAARYVTVGSLIVPWIIFVILIVFGNTGFGQTWSAEQKEILEVVDWVWENVKKGDSSHVSDDFVGWHTNWHAPYTKAELLPWYDRFQTNNKTILIDYQPLAVEIYGDVAIVFYTYRLLREDKEGEDTTEQGRWIDTYRKENGKWMLIAESGHVTSSDN